MSPKSLPSQITAVIEQLETRAVQAFRDHDTGAMDELHDDRCIGVGVLGAQYEKAEFLEAFRTALAVQSIDLLETQIVVEDSFAVALSNWDVKVSFGPQRIEGRVRVTRTWVKRPQGWKIISFHFSDVRLATAWEKLKTGKTT